MRVGEVIFDDEATDLLYLQAENILIVDGGLLQVFLSEKAHLHIEM